MLDYKAFGLLELWMWKGGTNLKMSIKWEGVHISHFLGIVPSTHCETSKKIAWQAQKGHVTHADHEHRETPHFFGVVYT